MSLKYIKCDHCHGGTTPRSLQRSSDP